MPDRLITHLRHIDLAVPDHGKQLDFFTGAWGLTAEHSDSGLTFLAAEGSPEQYVVRLRQAADKRVDLIAFGAASAADVDTLAARLGAGGVQLVSEPGALSTPGGGYGFRFFDNEGRTVEVSSDVAIRAHRKIEAGQSIPVRLSHVVVNSATPEATVAWYERHLGFRLSDILTNPAIGSMMWFLRINAWHHSLAFARCPHPSLHHASFELRGIDEYMRGTGRLLRSAWRRCGALGGTWPATTPSATSSTRTATPSSTRPSCELVDDDTWHPHLYDFTRPEVADQWGTANAINEFTAARSFNDPDSGLFTAPPV